MANEITIAATLQFSKNGVTKTFPFSQTTNKADEDYTATVYNIGTGGTALVTTAAGCLAVVNRGSQAVLLGSANGSQEFATLAQGEMTIVRTSATPVIYAWTAASTANIEVVWLPTS